MKIIENINFDVPKTNRMYKILKTLGLENKKILFLVDKYSESAFLSARNIHHLRISLAKDANTYDIMWAEVLLLTKESVGIINEVFHG